MLARYSSLIVLFVVVLLDTTASGFLMPVIGQIFSNSAADLSLIQISPTQNIILDSSVIILLSPVYFFAAPLLGYCSDRYGRKKILIYCICASILAYSLIALGLHCNLLWLCVLGMFFFNIGGSLLPLVQAAIADNGHMHKAYYYAIVMAIMTVLFPFAQFSKFILSGNFFYGFTQERFLILMSALELLNLLLIGFCFIDTTAMRTRVALIKQDVSQELEKIKKNKILWRLLLLFFIFEFSWGLYFQNIPYFLDKAVFFNAEQSALYIIIHCATMVFALLLLYPVLMRYLNAVQILVFCFVINILGLILCNIAETMTLQWFAIIPMSIGMSIMTPLFWLLISNHADRTSQGFVMGLAGATWALAWMVSGFAAICLAKLSPALNWQLAFVLTLFLMLLWNVMMSRYVTE